MAIAFLEPSAFPGGKPGLFSQVETTSRTAVQAPYPLGTKAKDALGNEYTYVQAGGTIAATDAVRGGNTGGLAAVVQTGATATGEALLGVGHAAFTSGQFGWVLTRGVVSAKAGNVTPGAAVVPKTTAGTFNDAAAADVSTTGGAQAISDDSGGLATILLM